MTVLCARHAGAVEYRFYHSDPLGSNTVITDRSGTVVQRTVNTPYGEQRAAVDPSGQSINPTANSTRHLFTGQEHDAESGLHYFGARYYDPFVGRFMAADPGIPAGGGSFVQIVSHAAGLNAHAYTLNQPTLRVDPTGEIGVVAVLGAVALGLAAYDLYQSGLGPDLAAVASNPTSDNFEAFALSQFRTTDSLTIAMTIASRRTFGSAIRVGRRFAASASRRLGSFVASQGAPQPPVGNVFVALPENPDITEIFKKGFNAVDTLGAHTTGLSKVEARALLRELLEHPLIGTRDVNTLRRAAPNGPGQVIGVLRTRKGFDTEHGVFLDRVDSEDLIGVRRLTEDNDFLSVVSGNVEPRFTGSFIRNPNFGK